MKKENELFEGIKELKKIVFEETKSEKEAVNFIKEEYNLDSEMVENFYNYFKEYKTHKKQKGTSLKWTEVERNIVFDYVTENGKNEKTKSKSFKELVEILNYTERTEGSIQFEYYGNIKKMNAFKSKEKEIKKENTEEPVQKKKNSIQQIRNERAIEEYRKKFLTKKSNQSVLKNETNSEIVYEDKEPQLNVMEEKMREIKHEILIDENVAQQKKEEQKANKDESLENLTNFIKNAQILEGLNLNGLFEGLAKLSDAAVKNNIEPEEMEKEKKKNELLEVELKNKEELIELYKQKIEEMKKSIKNFSELDGMQKIVDLEIVSKQLLQDIEKLSKL